MFVEKVGARVTAKGRPSGTATATAPRVTEMMRIPWSFYGLMGEDECFDEVGGDFVCCFFKCLMRIFPSSSEDEYAPKSQRSQVAGGVTRPLLAS